MMSPTKRRCLYLTIQLFFSHVHSPAFLISSPTLRNLIHTLLTTTPVGHRILHDHDRSRDSITLIVLPNLRNTYHSHRDTYVSDSAIAAMATLPSYQPSP